MKSGEFVGITKGMVLTTGGIVDLKTFNKGNYNGIYKGFVPIIDGDKNKHISVEEFKNGNFVPCFNKNGEVSIIDEKGNIKRISKNEYNSKIHMHESKKYG